MFSTKLLALVIAAVNGPYILFTQGDIPGSGLYCSLDSATYTTDLTLVVEASLCIPDRIFDSTFEGAHNLDVNK